MIIIILSFSNVLLADPPPNDDCENAMVISGEGVYHFDNSQATMDGPGDCILPLDNPLIDHDVWYCWKAPGEVTDGLRHNVTIETCGGTTVNTTIAVNFSLNPESCDCSRLDSAAACNSNACATQSRISFAVESGYYYMIRIGTPFTPELGGGRGTFALTMEEIIPATRPSAEGGCQSAIPTEALVSNGQDLIVADTFTPAESGKISEISWSGGYFNGNEDCLNTDDGFEIRYYLDDGGLPGPLIAGPFNNQNFSLIKFGKSTTGQIINGQIREYQYSGIHDPVPVIGGECYWIEIRNVSQDTCTWHWEIANGGDGWSVQDGHMTDGPDGYDSTDRVPEDLAFCLGLPLAQAGGCDVTSPVNDACTNPIEIFDGDTFFDTTGATTIESFYSINNCFFFLDDDFIHNDIWFDYVADCTGEVTLGLCDSNYDSKIVVYNDIECPSDFEAIVCNDDECSTDPAFDFISEVFTNDDSPGGEVANSRPQSNCFETLETPGCDDPDCMEKVCSVASFCCDSLWFPECARLAGEICLNTRLPGLQSEVSFPAIEGELYQIRIGGYREETGTGMIHLRIGETDPQDKNLFNLAGFINCFTGSCEVSPCDGDIYETPCCKLYDFDRDGDVDVEDFTRVQNVLVGP